tara:strand:+ start:233 stop:697 length:465 start_codon:yes stop_codon:yes gene_type:complete
MYELCQQIENTIRDEFSNLNNKLHGTKFLEALKFLILDKIKSSIILSKIEITENDLKNFEIKDEHKKMITNILICNSPKVYINKIIENSSLFICIQGKINIDINIKNKNNSFSLPSLTGITLPKDTDCSISMLKNSVNLEISLEDIENKENSTI